MRRRFLWFFLAILVVFIAVCLGTFLLARTMGYAVDWRAVFQMQPPIFKSQYRVIRIWFGEQDTFWDESSGLEFDSLDVWSVTDEYILGAGTDPQIRRLRRAGYQVDVLYRSLEEYSRAVEESGSGP